jgi:hypothetical protein
MLIVLDVKYDTLHENAKAEGALKIKGKVVPVLN